MSKRKKKTTGGSLELNDDDDQSSFNKFDAKFYAETVNIGAFVEEELRAHWTCMLTMARNGFQEHGQGYVHIKTNRMARQFLFWGLDGAKAYFVPQVIVDQSYDPETEVRIHIEFEDGILEGMVFLESGPERAQKPA